MPGLLVALVAAAAACPEGQLVSPDTNGNCCWPGQAWSSGRSACVGTPTRCPGGRAPTPQGCGGCAAGMEVGPDTAGHCCWPDQAWSSSRQVCIGAPRCPAGYSPQAEACVQGSSAGAPPPPPPPPSTTAGPGDAPPPPPPPSAQLPPSPAAEAQVVDGLTVPPGHHVEYKRKLGLLIPGIAVLAAGWLGSVLVAIGGGLYSVFKPTNTCWAAAAEVGWIPIIGPLAAMARQTDQSLHDEGHHQCLDSPVWPIGSAVGAVLEVMQVAGLALTIVGIVVRSPVVVPDEPGGGGGESSGVSIRLLPGVPGSPLGMSFALTGW